MRKILTRICAAAVCVGLMFQPVQTVPMAADITSQAEQQVTQEEMFADVTYQVYMQSQGWKDTVEEGVIAGLPQEGKMICAMRAKVSSNLKGSIQYSVYSEGNGWTRYSSNGKLAGFTKNKSAISAIRVKLTGELAQNYNVVYRVYRESFGWTQWKENAAVCGSAGKIKGIEAIQIRLAKKTQSPEVMVAYRSYIQKSGWLKYVSNGKASGIGSKNRRIEAMNIEIAQSNIPGGIEYSACCESKGWTKWKTDGKQVGTSHSGKRLEALKIRLTGKLAEVCDVYYRTYCEGYGWLGWAKNGATAGNGGIKKYLGAVQIRVVPKGAAAPGSTKRPYINKKIAALIEEEKAGENPAIEEQLLNDESENELNKNASSKNLNAILNATELKPVITNDAVMDNKVKSILAKVCTEKMTNQEKLYACFQWIMDKSEYKLDGNTISWSNTNVDYESLRDLQVVSFAYPIIVGVNGSRYGTCINYASAFVVLARALGYEAYRVGGKVLRAGGSYGEHYWAVIKINGVWYNFDPQIADNSWAKPEEYFGKTNPEWKKMGYKFIDVEGFLSSQYMQGVNNFKVRTKK
ncbi:MAG: transglutaminase domain-containing protein [Wujia sp.]